MHTRRFTRDAWERGAASRGITAVLEGGALLEKAAANVSVVSGALTAARAAAMTSRGRAEIDPKGGQPYYAAALSLVCAVFFSMIRDIAGRGFWG
jgi:coproporphyrinogen III oxidase